MLNRREMFRGAGAISVGAVALASGAIIAPVKVDEHNPVERYVSLYSEHDYITSDHFMLVTKALVRDGVSLKSIKFRMFQRIDLAGNPWELYGSGVVS